MAFLSRRLWLYEENRRKIMTAIEREDAPGLFLQLQHGQTHYELVGEPHQPLLVCIHGWSSASYVWKPLRPSLLAKGYHVLTYDLYGRGYSARPSIDQSAELFTNQLTELLDHLGLNDTRLNIVGYSMGGAIAARFVCERLDDVERLLLIAPAGMAVRSPVARAIARTIPSLFDPLILANLPRKLREQFMLAAAGFKDEDTVRRVLENQLRELDYQGYLPSLLSSMKGVLASRMIMEHRKIAESDVAVRAIFAEQDKTIPYSKAKKRFDKWNRNGVSVGINDAGHAITYTHTPKIMNLVGDFL